MLMYIKMSLFEFVCDILNTACSVAVLWSIYDDKKNKIFKCLTCENEKIKNK